ncbi:MAG TPA: tyrosine--tRNA ligase [Kofleriaceae bacterium]|jgi:tyrosyl-tRNA synthetase|nr:tyrosine--tRNA ligase [Kofleriaceae bacterium]
MALLDELNDRGLLADVTDREGLAALLASESIPVYVGYDPTATSLHVGNLVPTMLLKRFQLAGHKPIVLVGGATGMIGDPGGKSTERNLLDEATLATNVAGIRAQLSRLLEFDDSPTGAMMTNNIDWTRDVGYLEFLRDIGKHLTINYMLGKDSVNSRLGSESGISYTEFSYMLLQAFDFVQLWKRHGCRLQMGGSDQYGNITAGCELQHKLRGPKLFGLTAPLLLDSRGEKMGKTSEGERIWLDPERTTPYDFYQYWFNRNDEEAPRMLRLFSLRPLAELDDILRTHDADRAKRTVQRELARALTTWVHGAAAVPQIEVASRVMFGEALDGLTDADLALLTRTLNTIDVPRTELATGVNIVDLLARTVCDSKGAARRLITQGGAYINNQRVTQVEHQVTLEHLATETMLVVRNGKKIHCLVRAI